MKHVKKIILCVSILLTFSMTAIAKNYSMHLMFVNHTNMWLSVKTEPMNAKGCFFDGSNYNKMFAGKVPPENDNGPGAKIFEVICYNPGIIPDENNRINFWLYNDNIENDLNTFIGTKFGSVIRTFVTNRSGSNGNTSQVKIWLHNTISDYPIVIVDPLNQ